MSLAKPYVPSKLTSLEYSGAAGRVQQLCAKVQAVQNGDSDFLIFWDKGLPIVIPGWMLGLQFCEIAAESNLADPAKDKLRKANLRDTARKEHIFI